MYGLFSSVFHKRRSIVQVHSITHSNIIFLQRHYTFVCANAFLNNNIKTVIDVFLRTIHLNYIFSNVSRYICIDELTTYRRPYFLAGKHFLGEFTYNLFLWKRKKKKKLGSSLILQHLFNKKCL